MNVTLRPVARARRSTPALLAAFVGAMAATAVWVERASRRADRKHPPQGRFLHIDGVRLHCRVQGEGPAVLLLHGNLVHGADFDASGLVARLAATHTVIVIDRPGFGYSDRPRGKSWTPGEQARLLGRAMIALGFKRAAVVGHSLGTQVAIGMALEKQIDVTALVLVSGYYYPGLRLDALMTLPTSTPVLGDALRYTTSALSARLLLGPSVRAMFAPQPVPDQFGQALPRDMLLRPLQQRATSEDGSAMVGQARALRKQYGSLRMPVTLIAGAKDKVVSPKAQTMRLHEELRGSGLHVLPGVGHMAHYHAQDLIAQAVSAAS